MPVGYSPTARTERVKAHIFVCFLAYVLWKTLEKWQSQAGLGSSPRTLLEELRHIQSVDVVLPTLTNPPRQLVIRCVVRPDRSQAILLDRMGIVLPHDYAKPHSSSKCSANFSCNSLILRDRTPRTAEVGLTLP